jgi:hypothetical protein
MGKLVAIATLAFLAACADRPIPYYEAPRDLAPVVDLQTPPDLVQTPALDLAEPDLAPRCPVAACPANTVCMFPDTSCSSGGTCVPTASVHEHDFCSDGKGCWPCKN